MKKLDRDRTIKEENGTLQICMEILKKMRNCHDPCGCNCDVYLKT
jgi:hypothetical protein